MNEAGQPVSGQIMQQGIDFSLSQIAAERLFTAPISEIASKLGMFYEDPFPGQAKLLAGHETGLMAAPILPLMIVGFEYQDGNTLPLSLFYLGIGIVLLALWLIWLRRMGLPEPALLLFAMLPNPLWFTLNVSSDLPFAMLFAVFYLGYFSRKGEAYYWALWGTALILLALTRVNGLSMLLLVLTHHFIASYRNRSVNIFAITGLSVLTFVVAVYFLPYISAVLQGLAREHEAYSYFGYSTQAYIGGIFELLPKWLNLAVSWLTLVGAKLLYFVGLRPSYADVAWWIVALRGGAGLILLPGLVWVIICGDTKHRMLIGFYLVPFVIGPSQDRYNLAIQPLLFYFGYLGYRDVFALFFRGKSAR